MMTRRLVHILVACLMAGVAAPSAAQDSLPGPPEIRSSGTARRTVPPDWATVTLQYSVSDSTPGAAMHRLSVRTDAVRRVLQALGVSADSMIVGGSRPWWSGRMETISSSRCVTLPDRPAPCVNVTDTSYRARENIEIRIHAIHLVRSVIDSALAMGISEIPSVRFAATSVTPWEDEALREATRRARERAEILAHESGGSLGSLIWLRIDPERSPETPADGVTATVPFISRGVVPRPFVEMMAVPLPREKEMAAVTIEVEVTVSGIWRFKPGPR